MKRTNIMLTVKQHKEIKEYAKKHGKTLGSMVREALDTVYQKRGPLEQRRQAALDAYREGLISLGKLAEVLGLDPVGARQYLKEKGMTRLSRRACDCAEGSLAETEEQPHDRAAARRALEKFVSHGGRLSLDEIDDILREEESAS